MHTRGRSGIVGRILGGIVLLVLAAAIFFWIGSFIADRRVETGAPTLAAVAPPVVETATPPESPTETPTSMPAAVVVESPVPTNTAVPTQTALPSATPTETAVSPTPPPATFTPAAPAPRVVAVQVPINLHTDPHISYPSLAVINEQGAQFDLVGQLETGGWWQICCLDGAEGWIAADTVDIVGSVSSVPFVPLPDPQLIITASRFNVRSGPGINYPVLATVEVETVLDLMGRLNDGSWWQVCCVPGGPFGWVFTEGVAILGNEELVPIVPAPPLPTETPAP